MFCDVAGVLPVDFCGLTQGRINLLLLLGCGAMGDIARFIGAGARTVLSVACDGISDWFSSSRFGDEHLGAFSVLLDSSLLSCADVPSKPVTSSSLFDDVVVSCCIWLSGLPLHAG